MRAPEALHLLTAPLVPPLPPVRTSRIPLAAAWPQGLAKIARRIGSQPLGRRVEEAELMLVITADVCEGARGGAIAWVDAWLLPMRRVRRLLTERRALRALDTAPTVFTPSQAASDWHLKNLLRRLLVLAPRWGAASCASLARRWLAARGDLALRRIAEYGSPTAAALAEFARKPSPEALAFLQKLGASLASEEVDYDSELGPITCTDYVSALKHLRNALRGLPVSFSGTWSAEIANIVGDLGPHTECVLGLDLPRPLEPRAAVPLGHLLKYLAYAYAARRVEMPALSAYYMGRIVFIHMGELIEKHIRETCELSLLSLACSRLARAFYGSYDYACRPKRAMRRTALEREADWSTSALVDEVIRRLGRALSLSVFVDERGYVLAWGVYAGKSHVVTPPTTLNRVYAALLDLVERQASRAALYEAWAFRHVDRALLSLASMAKLASDYFFTRSWSPIQQPCSGTSP